MSGAPTSNRRRRVAHGGHEEEGGSERWLLTYADMITLLLALFIVLWSISSVNISKFAALKDSLTQGFSGKGLQGGTGVLDGGTSPLNPQGTQIQNVNATSSSSATSLPDPTSIAQSIRASINTSLGRTETDNLRQVQREVNAAARKLHL